MIATAPLPTSNNPVFTPATISPAPAEPKRVFRFSKDQFYRMAKEGYFYDARVELINGELIIMPPEGKWHAWGVDMMQELLKLALGSNFWVRGQHSLDLSPFSVPAPDLAVIPRRLDQGPTDTPTTALLIIEISDSTLGTDRVRKGSLYASVGIQDYWIVNYVHRCIEVYRNPVEDAKEEFGWRYASTTTHEAGEIAMLAVPTAKIEVAKLFP